MTTPLDEKIVPKVAEVISKYGISATFHVEGAPTKSADRQTATATETTYSVKISPPTTRSSTMLPDLVEHGTSFFFVAGQGLLFTPDAGQSVSYGGRRYRVRYVEEIRSGDSVAAWEIGVKR